jgi:high affinity cGMP-specific 3',5'-cyclic phosphodiesterase 9
MIVKCSDISTEVRPPNVAGEIKIILEKWVDLLLEEFFCQSDREKSMGLPTMPFMDREKVTKPSAQIGFIQFVMIPLYCFFDSRYETFALVCPTIENDFIVPIRKSLKYYKVMAEETAANLLVSK